MFENYKIIVCKLFHHSSTPSSSTQLITINTLTLPTLDTFTIINKFSIEIIIFTLSTSHHKYIFQVILRGYPPRPLLSHSCCRHHHPNIIFLIRNITTFTSFSNSSQDLCYSTKLDCFGFL